MYFDSAWGSQFVSTKSWSQLLIVIKTNISAAVIILSLDSWHNLDLDSWSQKFPKWHLDNQEILDSFKNDIWTIKKFSILILIAFQLSRPAGLILMLSINKIRFKEGNYLARWLVLDRQSCANMPVLEFNWSFSFANVPINNVCCS